MKEGLAARRRAAEALFAVLKSGAALDDALADLARRAHPPLPARDHAFARAIATVALRRLGTIRHALNERAPRGLPHHAAMLEWHLIVAAAQILFLDAPDHAAVDAAVSLVREDKRNAHRTGFVNALLRRIAGEREAILKEADADPGRDVPDWLFARWSDAFGADKAAAIALALRSEPALDLTVKSDPDGWAARLDAIVLPTGSLRLRGRTSVPELPGYKDGQWWVQDAAAALPAQLLNVRPGEMVADLCAAPGGKTAQLALTGAEVLAVDRSRPRLARLKENMDRLGLAVRIEAADALALKAGPFDAILLDAPCSATGTIRRHPEIAWTKTPEDIAKLADLQARLLDKALELLKPGGRLVYATCSLEPEEGERQIAACLARNPHAARLAVHADELPGLPEALTPDGDVRTRPGMLANPDPRLAGLDGFFVARLTRR